ncbi:hypothetical protein CWD94_17115 [Lysinibacillus xylanilyticus]|uniref:Uncharacterized protein n=1 Tax=Lysinibacillus xylanilyticus TaxID=582475 RepID=A0A2M9Q394_9BACI|nr:hypothetical protein CWD94_17115 [Lysinibacillus xylanilyticus]
MVFLLFGNSTVSFASYALNTKKETKNTKGIIRADNSKVLTDYLAIQGVAQTHYASQISCYLN